PPEHHVLAQRPDRLPGLVTRARALTHGLGDAFVADPETAPVRSVVLERAHRPVRVKLRDQPLVTASDGVDRGLLAAPQPAAQFFDVAPFEELLEVRVVELGVVGGPWGCVVVPDEVGDAGSLLDPLLAALGLLRA